MKGKTAIELGSGMGLGGFALALLGCHTAVTDTKEVLGLLQRNYEINLTAAALKGAAVTAVDNVHVSCCANTYALQARSLSRLWAT